jgi:protease IV
VQYVENYSMTKDINSTKHQLKKEKLPIQTIEVKPKATKWLVALILLNIPSFLTGLLWLVITILIFAGVAGAVSSAEDVVAQEDKLVLNTSKDNSGTQDSILVYKLRGPIDTGDTDTLGSLNENIYTSVVKKDFEEIKNNKNIKNIVFHLDTPGGTVFASEVLGDLIKDLMDNKGLNEAVFYYDQTVASGGLYSSNKVNNYIVASPYGGTGSIGVVSYLPNIQGLAEKVGYKQVVIKSAASKDYGNPFRDLSEDEKGFLQGQVDRSYNEFIDIVASGRKLERAKVEQVATGYVYDNQQAFEVGLVNELGSVSKAVEKAANNVQLTNYDLLEVEPKSNVLDIFGSAGLASAIKSSVFNQEKLLQTNEFIKPGVQYYLDPSFSASNQ